MIFWYKKDLRSFLKSCLGANELVAGLNWDDYKRPIVGQLVDSLAADQHRYFNELLDLVLATSEMNDPVHLRRLDDGEAKYADAVAAVDSLRRHVEPYRKLRTEKEDAARRREAERIQAAMQRAMNEKLEELRKQFNEIIMLAPQPRGYALEKFLNELFPLFDIEAKSSFKVTGEQIDGAFTFEGEYLLEAKWWKEPTSAAELYEFEGKVNRKLDNTLGLFLAMNGFQPTAIEALSHNRPKIILMDGSDLNAVVEGRIGLPELLRRKRQHGSRTGDVYIRAYDLLD